MHPVIFRIPFVIPYFGETSITINSYGVMVAMGFVVAIVWVYFESRRLGQNPARALDLVFYILIAAIVGSRIFHIAISERSHFLENPLMIFQIWRGGLMFYGGLICSVAVSVWFIRRHRMPYLLTFDIFAPAIALGHAVGRIGCFLAGCCHGRVVHEHHWYTVVFPSNVDSFAPGGVPLYPTQLMESFGEVLIFAMLFALRYFKKFNGQIIATYIMLYAILRYVNEFFRGDFERGFLIEPWLSSSQFISIIMLAIGTFMYIKLWPGRRTE